MGIKMIDAYVVFDIETTGLNPKTDRIIEIGAVKVEDGKIIDTFSVLIDAGIDLPKHIVTLTGIDNEMLIGAKTSTSAISEFIDFCEDYILVGHNIIFDYSFVKRFAVNNRIPFDKMGIDTLKIARKTLPNLEKKSLEFLCNYYRIEQVKKHRALEDAMATKELLDRLLEDFAKSNQEVFKPYELIYQIKREGPITSAQRSYLNDLINYHRIELEVVIETLTKNEASRCIDKIIFQHGRIIR